ncbi:putative baseplate assembly protein [Paenibacillus allorhizosphaerae]|uniref:Baseplate assembly protein n=1 Tax=Paenibacillus allorhizosphaerae TaxID=2849866 RepID=A0ABN7TMJ7_9BACL|nr:putative baseplate assembly protein [Paenibacillus allorhizosphaerae]CAG7640730.1 hypothetical protein PAECIP111802_02678 [Paenibacillus allorhizosphaerae]
MLPVPNLDDRMFEQMVSEARKAIPKILPMWTDVNYHDPGITLVELFAWLSEMQQYYLNRITPEQEIKFLKLLGIALREAVPARMDVTFGQIGEELLVPAGTPILAVDQHFEIASSLQLIKARLEKVIVRSGLESVDFTSSNGHKGAVFYAFGAQMKKGNRLCLGFDSPLPVNKEITLTMNLHELFAANPLTGAGSAKAVIPSGKISWKYYGESVGHDGEPDTLPIHVVRDETIHMSQSGRISFIIPSPMQSVTLHPANDKSRFWMVCTLEEEGYEISPRVENIAFNTGMAIQRKSWSEAFLFNSNGKRSQSVTLTGYLASCGHIIVQVKHLAGWWQDWRETQDFGSVESDFNGYKLQFVKETMELTVTFGDGKHGSIPPQGRNRIRIITVLPELAEGMYVGRSNGLPNQTFKLEESSILRHSLKLQVGRRQSASGDWLWEDWEQTEDFALSGAEDKHYKFLTESSEIVFGNNEHGAIPYKSAMPNIRLIAWQTGGGERGNVQKEVSSRLLSIWPEHQALTVTNYRHAHGGKGKETIDEAKRRLIDELDRPYRAVTNEDYEYIARTTPGLRVARVKAIPLYRPGMTNYPQEKEPAQLTLVVVPYSEAAKPMPSPGFLETVSRHLDKHRLITTEIHVIPPEYIQITVHAIVVVDPFYMEESNRIEQEIEMMFSPLDREDTAAGWEFGRTVYKGDIYGVMNSIPGVEYIQDLWVIGEGKGAVMESNGDIRIPPYALVYSGKHQIHATTR